MEFKDRKNHYLHPDFEDTDCNKEKKPSPLALLAQTCKNVGTMKDPKDMFIYNRNNSPNSSSHVLGKFAKRCRSDSSSNSSSTDRDYLSPMKRSRVEPKYLKKKKFDSVELKNADTSSEASINSATSLISNLINFVKHSNSSKLVDADKMELIDFLANQQPSQDSRAFDLSKPNDCLKKSNQFNVETGYHLDNHVDAPSNQVPITINQNYASHISQDSPSDRYFSSIDPNKPSAIKYCMYCGQLIPILPMLLAHIRLEHGTVHFPEPSINSPSHVPNMFDLFSKFNPYLSHNEVKSSQTFSLLADYMTSSFKGLNNLIC